jgi:hypothetical protein
MAMGDKGTVVVLALSSVIGSPTLNTLSGEKERLFVGFLYGRRIKQEELCWFISLICANIVCFSCIVDVPSQTVYAGPCTGFNCLWTSDVYLYF